MIKDIYLLVGGEATRLRPLSEGIPKALLTIKGKPLIDLILSNLSDTNIMIILYLKKRFQETKFELQESVRICIRNIIEHFLFRDTFVFHFL